jgi:excisionase family DNA binding protein
MKPFMTLTEAAEALGKSEETVRSWAASGKIPAGKIERCWVFVTEDLINHVRKTYKGQQWQSNESERPGTSTSRPQLGAYASRLKQLIESEPNNSTIS